MRGKPDKPHRIRVRVLDAKPRTLKDLNQLKSNQLGMSHLDIHGTGVEFIVCAPVQKHIEQVRAKLAGVGLEEIAGDTTIPLKRQSTAQARQRGPQHRGAAQRRQVAHLTPRKPLPAKPYGFVPLPSEFTKAAPVWHDGTSSEGRLSGEVRFQIETLTPLLVGWERGQVGNRENEWPLPKHLGGQLGDEQSVLCPLRAPWGRRPVIIPGDSLKGLLRHELGALLGAPMERVAQRSYSYRPNAKFPDGGSPRLIPRLARVPDSVELQELPDGHLVRVPKELELLPSDLQYDRERERSSNYYRFDDKGGARYRGGQGAGERLNSKRKLHTGLIANPSAPTETVAVSQSVKDGYVATLCHLTDVTYGHFSTRHPDVPREMGSNDARNRIREAATNEVFQPGDLIWVEWDTEKKCIVSLGWHYYYRWAYTDSVRTTGTTFTPRSGLFPLDDECADNGDGAPRALSAVRRIFGYTGDNEGSKRIGEDDYAQLMGRVSLNAALEIVGDDDTDKARFLPDTYLKELGMPRPSAVEHYLQQPHYPESRPSDGAALRTYGDAAGYDAPGVLAGRKFYLDREDAYTGEPWKAGPHEKHSTLAQEASTHGRHFRFTLRFRDLDPHELAATLVALCPQQFRSVLGGDHGEGYCSKLGYARPLGWGTVRIEGKALLLLDTTSGKPSLTAAADLVEWVTEHYRPTEVQAEWLSVHRHRHPDAADYPRAPDKNGEHIYTFHTNLRADHSRDRRYRNKEK